MPCSNFAELSVEIQKGEWIHNDAVFWTIFNDYLLLLETDHIPPAGILPPDLQHQFENVFLPNGKRI